MSSNFYIDTDKIIGSEKPTWSMTVGVEDTYLMGNIKREAILLRQVKEELDCWSGVLWYRHTYNIWWWFDKEDMDSFVTYFMLKYN